MNNLIMPEFITLSGWGGAPESWSTEIEYDDAAINACRHDKDWPSNCQTCPARRRCDELVRTEWAREMGLEPPEEVKE